MFVIHLGCCGFGTHPPYPSFRYDINNNSPPPLEPAEPKLNVQVDRSGKLANGERERLESSCDESEEEIEGHEFE